MLDGQSGDRQARAEALMLLLLCAGERPHRLVHGQGRDAWHVAVLPMDETLAADPALAERAVRIGRSRWLVLVPDAPLEAGQIPEHLRAPESGRWTDSIAVQLFRPPADPEP